MFRQTFSLKPSLEYNESDFINMQFSCQRNSDLIELPRHQLLSREEDGVFAGLVETAMYTIAAKLIFSRD
ncbi:MAG: hypothetical protein H8D23_08395 [Candidatus Brocadiales bacterium]|nr:hypothetical protein [Candidatus Brocadiales bacterium]